MSETELDSDNTSRIAAHAAGRPGYALTLAMGDGGEAIKLAHGFLSSIKKGSDISRIANAVSGKAADEKWAVFKETLINSIADAAQIGAVGKQIRGPLAGCAVADLVDALDLVQTLLARGEGLNLDRGQLIKAIFYDLTQSLRPRAA